MTAVSSSPTLSRRVGQHNVGAPTFDRAFVETEKCALSCAYFIHHYIQITDKNNPDAGWFPFRLWLAQRGVLDTMIATALVLVLKARQLGLSWLTLAYALWLGRFQPGATILLFSRTDVEAVELLGRVKEMHQRLPEWLRLTAVTDNDHEFELSNGSRWLAFRTSKHSGRSFTATLVIVDEAWFIQWFSQLMNAVKPTIDNGGRLIAITTADKERPNHLFSQLWRKARAGQNNYTAVFLPWYAHPTRDAAWYAQQVADYTQDDLWQEYPETPEQALAGRQASKRFNPQWLTQCYDPRPSLPPALTLPGLTVYERPQPGRSYLLACDTSEGDVTSDPSPVTVFDADNWAEVAQLYGIFEPSVLAGYLWQLAVYYGDSDAVICVERNNHGHAVLLTLRELDIAASRRGPVIYRNPHDRKPGWLSNTKWKHTAVDKTAECLRDGSLTIRSENTKLELANFEAATLKAPEGDTDDLAMTVVIGVAALIWPTIRPQETAVVSQSFVSM